MASVSLRGRPFSRARAEYRKAIALSAARDAQHRGGRQDRQPNPKLPGTVADSVRETRPREQAIACVAMFASRANDRGVAATVRLLVASTF